MLKVDYRKSHINVTAKAQRAMAALEVGQSVRGRRRDVVNPVNGFRPIDGTAQIRCLARGTIAGKDVVVLFERHQGTPWGSRQDTVRVGDVFDAAKAEKLLALGLGLSPFFTTQETVNDPIENN